MLLLSEFRGDKGLSGVLFVFMQCTTCSSVVWLYFFRLHQSIAVLEQGPLQGLITSTFEIVNIRERCLICVWLTAWEGFFSSCIWYVKRMALKARVQTTSAVVYQAKWQFITWNLCFILYLITCFPLYFALFLYSIPTQEVRCLIEDLQVTSSKLSNLLFTSQVNPFLVKAYLLKES